MSEYEHPKHRNVLEWLQLISQGNVSLPRFQRGLVWKDETIEEFILALLKKRPVGVLLILENDVSKDEVAFAPQRLRYAPEINKSTCRELILDGQQRLTALWRAIIDAFYFVDSIESPRRFFIKVNNLDNDSMSVEESVEDVRCIKANSKQDGKAIKDAREAFDKGLVPVNLMADRITQDNVSIENWCDEVFPDNSEKSRSLERNVRKLSELLRSRNIAYYSLPPDTSREDAIDTFIKTNESSSKVSRFDIAVAEIEVQRRQPLREMVREINIEPQRLTRFFGDDEDRCISDIGELALKIACLLVDCPQVPTDKYYTDKSVIDVVTDRWSEIEKAIDWTLEFFESECLYDKRRLPSVVPLRVIPALYIHFCPPESEPDKQARFSKIVRQYCWSSFVTNRYERNVNVRLWEDYKSVLKCGIYGEIEAPIFDKSEYPVPTINELADLKHPLPPPTGVKALSRAIIVVSLKSGAIDLASDVSASKDNIHKRQYHHLFPKALLKKEGRTLSEINHPLNYALVSETTNKMLAAEPPVEYLKKRLKLDFDIGDIKRRVESHLIPFEQLNVNSGLNNNYERFINSRAKLFEKALNDLCEGRKV